jgi:hypothetical protein
VTSATSGPADPLLVKNATKLGTLVAAALMALSPAAEADRRYGVSLDAGVPDGANGSLVYRPWSFVRVHVGGGHNAVAPGVRMGLTLVPWGSGISASVDAGHTFRGDANPLARMVSGDASLDVAALREVGYDYANLHLGYEWGRRWATFYLHGGLSYITGVVKNANETFAKVDDYTDVTFHGDPKVNVWAPSVRLGVIVYFAR